MPQTQAPDKTAVHDLIARMLDFEAVARERGIDFSKGRFRNLTPAQRQLFCAELTGDYIILSAGRAGLTDGNYSDELARFCSKILQTQVPSHELLGTYLAAVEIISKDWAKDSDHAIIDDVLRTCVDLMSKMTRQAQPAAARS